MKNIWFAIALACLLTGHAIAQDSGLRSVVAPPAEYQNAQIRNLSTSNAMADLVANTATEAPLWADKETAVWFLANAADLIWDDTPAQAQKWLRKAWVLARDVSDSPKDEKLKEFFSRSAQVDSRTAVLGVARKHDHKLADELLNELAESKPKEKTDKGAFDDRTARSEQLLQMSLQVVDSNPEVAFSLAEQSLGDGISYSLQNVLTSLRLKNVELANRLFDLAMLRFRSGFPEPSEAQVLAGYLFQSGFTFSSNSSGQTILAVNPAYQDLAAVALTERQRANGFLSSAYQILARPLTIDSSLNRQRAEQILVLGGRLLPQYDAFDPELAPSARGLVAQLQRQLYPQAEATSSSTSARNDANSESTKHLTTEEIYDRHISALEEKAARQNDPISRKLGYVSAAIATTPQDYQRAIRIIDKIDDDNDLRKDATAFLFYRASLSFIGRGDFDKATELKQQVHHFARQAVLNIAMAQHYASARGDAEQKQLDRQRSFDLLNEVGRGLDAEKPSAKIAKIALARTAILANLDKAQGLAALEQTLQLINGLDSFDLRDASGPSLGLDDSVSRATIATPKVGFAFSAAVEPFLSTNLDEIIAAVETLRVKEVRGIARLEIAKLFFNSNLRSQKDPKLTQARPRN
jgi:hypothetical protein